MTLKIQIENPLAADLALLMARHTEAMHADTPPESIHMMDAAQLATPGIWFYVMRDGGAPIGMGALKAIGDDHAEIKSMHILAEGRGRGLARRMLDHLLAEARARGFSRLSLETGSQQSFTPARQLYLTAGFELCPPFAHYAEDPMSTFMTKAIG